MTGLLYDFVHLKRRDSGSDRLARSKYLNELAPFDTLNPSAENIARYIYEKTAKGLQKTPNGRGIARVTVWETDTSAATYRA